MIYILYGSDTKKKNAFAQSVAKGKEVVSISPRTLTSSMLLSYAHQASLFGEVPLIILDSPLSVSDVVFNDELFEALKNAETTFIILEDDLTAAEIKKYKKFADLKEFDLVTPASKANPFVIANAYGNKDKIGTWSTYRNILEHGGEPEAIAGMIFWKIKTLLTSPSQKPFTTAELKRASSLLIDVYHKAHGGEMELDVGLEQFILETL